MNEPKKKQKRKGKEAEDSERIGGNEQNGKKMRPNKEIIRIKGRELQMKPTEFFLFFFFLFSCPFPSSRGAGITAR